MSYIAMPFGWLMMSFYTLTKNYGIAVILFAVVIKIILLPFQAKSKRSMMRTTRLQPKLKELEKRHGANKQKYNEEVAKLYKEENINPMSGCLWSFLPLPILFALFYAIRFPLTIMMGVPKALLQSGGAINNMLQQLNFSTTMNPTYIEIAQAQFITAHFDKFAGLSAKLQPISFNFFGVDLGQIPQWNFLWTTNWNNSSVWVPGLLLFLIPITTALLTVLSSYISMSTNPSDPAQQGTMKSMMIFMPIMMAYFDFIMPAAVGVYTIVMSGLSVVQDFYLTKRYNRLLEIEDAEKTERRRLRDQEMEEKRLETERKKLENSTAKNPNTSKRKQQKNEHQSQAEKAALWDKKSKSSKDEPESPSRIGRRKFARGRAYDPNRYVSVSDDALIDEQAAVPNPEEGETEELAPGSDAVITGNSSAEDNADADDSEAGYDENAGEDTQPDGGENR